MRDFSQYSSAEEFVQDLVTEGVVPRNKNIQKLFPAVKPRFSRYYVDKLKIKILEVVKAGSGINEDGTTKDHRLLSRTNLGRAVRGDNYPVEFKAALEQLVAERKIKEEKLWSQKNKPCTYYHLFEF